MRDFLTRVISAALISMGLAALGHSAAYGDTRCQVTDPLTGECTVFVNAPETPSGNPEEGPKDTGSGVSCYWDGRDQGVSKPPPGPVPCSSSDGYWSNAYNCYISPIDPVPPAGDSSWQGHEPGDGSVYNCYQPQTGLLVVVWAQDPPPNSGAGPTPREVAQLAIEQMRLAAINIGIAPKPGPDSVGLVGMPVWMWAAAPNNHSVGPITASASAGGVTVSATAKVLRVTWDMGDGVKVVCITAGTPYKPEYGRKQSPDCGHVYMKSSADKPAGQFTVTATSEWVITWSGAGQSGTIRLGGLTRSTQITIGEAQVVVQ
jgi:hypothetical protein